MQQHNDDELDRIDSERRRSTGPLSTAAGSLERAETSSVVNGDEVSGIEAARINVVIMTS